MPITDAALLELLASHPDEPLIDALARVRGLATRARPKAPPRELPRFIELFTGAAALAETVLLGRSVDVGGTGQVSVATLPGVSAPPHDWASLRRAEGPQASALERAVPTDAWLVAARSPRALDTLLARATSWGDALVARAGAAFDVRRARARVERALDVDVDALDAIDEPLVLCGSDIHLLDGSDVTLIVEREGPLAAVLARSSACFAARGGVSVLSNSRAALERVLAVVDGQAPSLGDSDEYAVMRARMSSSERESTFVYLSDAFLRRQVSAGLRFAIARRAACLEALRAHERLSALARAGLAPPPDDVMPCPNGARRFVDEEGPCCAVHGRPHAPRPAIACPVDVVSVREADAYRALMRSYDAYWPEVFDPIGVSLALDDARDDVEVLVVPLIASSLYARLRALAHTTPGALDAHTPSSTVFSLALRVPKETRALGLALVRPLAEIASRADGVDAPALLALVERALGEQVTLAVCDVDPRFVLDVDALFSLVLLRDRAQGLVVPALVGTSLHAPVFVSIALDDVEAADRLLDEVDALLARRSSAVATGRMPLVVEFAREGDGREDARHATIRLGPVGVTLFWRRRGDTLVFASERALLDDEGARADGVPAPAHAALVLAPSRLVRGRADAERRRCERTRGRCRRALGHLEAARLVTSDGDFAACAERLTGESVACPLGGELTIDDVEGARCSVHGSVRRPRERPAPSMRRAEDVRVALSFEGDGLRARVAITRTGETP